MLIKICRDGELWLMSSKSKGKSSDLYLCYGVLCGDTAWMMLLQPFAWFGGGTLREPLYVVQGRPLVMKPQWVTREEAVAQLLELCRPIQRQYLQLFHCYYGRSPLVLQYVVADYVWERL